MLVASPSYNPVLTRDIVHSGIEYGDMQLIAEIYDVLKNLAGLTNEELAVTFAGVVKLHVCWLDNINDSHIRVHVDWNKTELESYLVDITAQIMNFRDDMGDGYLIGMCSSVSPFKFISQIAKCCR